MAIFMRPWSMLSSMRVARGITFSLNCSSIWLAGATGQPILPFHLEARRSWSARSWDRTQIPRPFTVVGLAVGPPIEVPGGSDDDMIESKRRELERALASLERRARELADAS